MPHRENLSLSTETLDDAPDAVLESPPHIAVIEIVEPQKEYPIGSVIGLTVNVRCPDGCDLGGGTLLIGDENDRKIVEQRLTNLDEGQGVNTTGTLSVQIPAEPGEHTWAIVFFPKSNGLGAETEEGVQTSNRVEHAIVQAEHRFFAHPHVTGLTVYREYQPVEIGKEYAITVGAECLTGCSLLGQKVRVHCGDELLALAELGEPTGALSKLYQATIPLSAPDTVGAYELKVSIDPDGLELAHTSNACRHYVSTRLPMQCRLAVKIVDSATLQPLASADIVARPKAGYPSWCHADGEGTALIDVTEGEHEISVSLENYEFATETVTVPEGRELVEITIPMSYHPPLFT